MSTDRAFVVQFRADTDAKAGRFKGRVEHVGSGRVAHFQSLDELLAFIVQMLAEVPMNLSQKT
jgi:hypothetical protein